MTAEIRIKDLILDNDPSTAHQAGASGKAAGNPVTYETVVNSGIDFAVRRTRGKSSTLLCVIASQGQYYVKNERTGEVAPLDDRRLSSFVSGAVSDIAVGNQWCSFIPKHKEHRDKFLLLVRREGFAEMVKAGAIDYGSYMASGRPYSVLGEAERALEAIGEMGALARHCIALGLSAEATQDMRAFEDAYGLENARAVATALAESVGARGNLLDETARAASGLLAIPASKLPARAAFDGMRGYGYRHHRTAALAAWQGETVGFRFDRLYGYLFDTSRAEGYADNLVEWASIWRDCIGMQIALAGRVADKYPENLVSYHNKLAYEVRQMRRQVSEELWAEAVRRHEVYDYEDGAYVLSHPASPEDMRDEAAQQCNCLASYIDRVAAGTSMVFFVRRAEAVGKSYLTVEVDPLKMALAQVKASHNREADPEGLAFVGKWADAHGVGYGRYAVDVAQARDRMAV